MVFSNKTQNWAQQQRNARAQMVVVASQRQQGNLGMNLYDIKNTKKGCKSCGGG
jgi:hypothetical protein|tara:strand:+ start:2537 stop:2698 length:162 start_codon:yes stop_codon:yes gene_type:complete